MASKEVIKFSLVSTLFNEASRLNDTINDIEAQTLKPDEIVLVDAGSNDGTLDILNDWKNKSKLKIVILVKPKCNVAEGRNLAIEKSINNIVVSTDFGCKFHKRWLESLIRVFDNDSIDVVGGNYTVLNNSIKTIPAKAAYYLSSKFEFSIDESFIPSSRSIAYKKSVWEQCGKYPEWLTLAADDYVYGLKLKKLGFKMGVAQEPYVYWLRHDTVMGYCKEANRYGLGDGEAGVNRRNFISNTIQLGLRYLFLLLIITLLVFPSKVFFIFILFSSLGFRSYFDAFRKWIKYDQHKSLKVFITMLYIIEGTRLYYIAGYVMGAFDNTPRRKAGLLELKSFLK